MANDGEVRRWLAYAAEDLAYGRNGVVDFPRAAAWNLQQAAEKALKAWLVSQDRVPPRTHDLVLLLNLACAKPEKELRDAVLKLAEVGASSRYPDDLEPITSTLATEYAQAAEAVVENIKRQLLAH